MPPGKDLLKLYLIFLTTLVLGSCSAAVLPSQTPTTLHFATTTASLTATITPTDTVTAHPIPSDTVTDTPQPTATIATPLAHENTPVPQGDQPISLANASRVVELARWGKGNANGMAYSPDGTIMAVASSLGIYFYDSNQKLVETIETDQPVDSLAFVPNSDLLAAGSQDGKIDFWQWQSKTLQKTIDSGELGNIDGIYFSTSSDLIGFVQRQSENDQFNYLFHVWRLAGQKELFEQAFDDLGGLAFSADFQTILMGETQIGKPGVRQYDHLDGSQEAVYYDLPGQDQAHSLALSGDGRHLAVGGIEKLYLWDTGANQPSKTFSISHGPVLDPGGPACGGTWDFFGFYAGHSLAYMPDGHTLLVGLDSGLVQARSASDGALMATFQDSSTSSILFQPGGKNMAFLHADGSINLRNRWDYQLVGAVSGHVSEFNSLAISPDNRWVAAGSSDSQVRIWDVDSKLPALELKAQANSLAFSPDGKFLALGADDGFLQIWDVKQSAWLGKRRDQAYRVTSLIFSPDSKTLYAVSNDCSLRLYQVSPGLPTEGGIIYTPMPEEVRVLDHSATGIPLDAKVAFTADGKWLAVLGTIGGDPSKLIDPKILSRQRDLNLGNNESYGGLTFSSDKRTLAVMRDSWLEIWNFDGTGQRETLKSSFSLNNYYDPGLFYSPDGSLLVAADRNGWIGLLEVANGQRLFQTSGLGDINALVFSGDGRYFVSASADGTVRVWGVPK